MYSSLKDWNNLNLNQLEQTGNYKVHRTTKKIPYEVFLLEKKHLRKISDPLSFESNNTESITRYVRQENTVHFCSKWYSVLLSIYKKQAQVRLYIADNLLKICNPSTGEVIAGYTFPHEKGRIFKNRNHSRERSTSFELMKQELITLFAHNEARDYIEKISINYGRYCRYQFVLIK